MSVARLEREPKRQLGQYLTPPLTASSIVDELELQADSRVLEPGFGAGSFIVPLVRRLMDAHTGPVAERLLTVLTHNVFGVEIDPVVYRRCLDSLTSEFGPLPERHNLILGDFLDNLDWAVPPKQGRFTHVVGNPPFGGTLDPMNDEQYEAQYGKRHGQKIKKETYSFFIVKALDLLSPGGSLALLCSDSLLSINTMRGLRDLLRKTGAVTVDYLDGFSAETSQPVVVLRVDQGSSTALRVFGAEVPPDLVERTPNHSWLITREYGRYFSGPKLGQYLVATGGMTTGRNEYFVRELVDGRVLEPYVFEFAHRPVSLEREVGRARLGQISASKRREIEARESSGQVERCLQVRRRNEPVAIDIPHPDYRYYNKAASGLIYRPPSHVIFWKDDGDAVLTYKRTGNWYLRGVGGGRFFGREGITWQLISTRLQARYLPAGYILDSGAPAAFLRPGVPEDELYFVLGWSLTRLCTRILKSVINHTRNIQGKDFERLPYPFWVGEEERVRVIDEVRRMVADGRAGRAFLDTDRDIVDLERLFSWPEHLPRNAEEAGDGALQVPLWAAT